MKSYIVIQGNIFLIYESKGRKVIKVNKNCEISNLNKVLTELFKIDRSSYLKQLIETEIPIEWCNCQYFYDQEYVIEKFPEKIL